MLAALGQRDAERPARPLRRRRRTARRNRPSGRTAGESGLAALISMILLHHRRDAAVPRHRRSRPAAAGVGVSGMSAAADVGVAPAQIWRRSFAKRLVDGDVVRRNVLGLRIPHGSSTRQSVGLTHRYAPQGRAASAGIRTGTPSKTGHVQTVTDQEALRIPRQGRPGKLEIVADQADGDAARPVARLFAGRRRAGARHRRGPERAPSTTRRAAISSPSSPTAPPSSASAISARWPRSR